MLGGKLATWREKGVGVCVSGREGGLLWGEALSGVLRFFPFSHDFFFPYCFSHSFYFFSSLFSFVFSGFLLPIFFQIFSPTPPTHALSPLNLPLQHLYLKNPFAISSYSLTTFLSNYHPYRHLIF